MATKSKATRRKNLWGRKKAVPLDRDPYACLRKNEASEMINRFDRWLLTTGLIRQGSSYYYEITSFLEDAVNLTADWISDANKN